MNKDYMIDRYIKEADAMEKRNQINLAIETLEKAIDVYNNEKMDERLFNINMKLGELNGIIGQTDYSLQFYNKAYENSIILENKLYMVDALVKISQIYFHMRMIDKSIEITEKAENILEDIDYIQGKLEVYLQWISVYYVKNEYFKAREIGNIALKLCGEDSLIYKGRILNYLARLYSDISSLDEHLNLLNQALECFEKLGLEMGILGIINNLGTVYSEKVQDNDKALEYFYSLKEKSENTNYKVLNIYAYNNSAEIYLRTFKYEKSILYGSVGRERAEKSNATYAEIYAYALLVNANIKIFDYEKAYFNLQQVDEKVKKYPNQATEIAWYFKSLAIFYSKMGQLEKARKFIAEALKMLEQEKSIIKWDCILISEIINIKKANKKIDILNSIEGIKSNLLNYKSKDIILNNVYEVVIKLINKGYKEIAFDFLKEYNIYSPENKRVEIKQRYLKALQCDKSEEKINILMNTLKEAKETNDLKIYWITLQAIAEHYKEKNDKEKFTKYNEETIKAAEDLLSRVPKEFRQSFISYNNMYN
ncbi:tetratricopeptide repeat protein [Clostridium grantii]|uniref:Tetratricopeptide repeat-containing protein n=1 Tax=Clostridium grantii DSM 8605 TaxID=1121316 RepID=A0A1M5RPK8_9CLOT|nr:hypothetical protein [Clostridium grantii]SHH28106.1 hypothetical protein SAMN02745207_00643 [Clostridium grantii DSM 8605]